MWSHCLRCKHSTERVVMPAATRRLPFGKSLELFFTSHPTSTNLPNYEHPIHEDYLYFYGLGPMVTAFKCPQLNIYTPCVPPPELAFNKQNTVWIVDDITEVGVRGRKLFLDVQRKL